MKKVVLAFSAMCLIAFTSCKEDATKKIDDNNVAAAAERDAESSKFPVLSFDKSEHDFGEIVSGTNVETVFNYTNTGVAPLVITDIKSTCGCTVPKDWSKAPLAPGATGSFTVKFNGKGTNKVSKAVTVTANTEKGREVVKISAFVKPDPNAPKRAGSAAIVPVAK
ncbi:DUF1573 domain-containing protein [Bizionia gelidisalsuginis]|uniref:DUF1573 domain-containing protein n=2 Tax=Bizionia TaxID=283785 RepID=A0A8H2LGL3_9FLAO|nr:MULTISPECIES: DUF1573 domain-containing protein [Bizionia]TYB80122.1 DUF1573 domain-containing protein [Bizionia saleffrena]TYC09713.1 DUF1573 domain-containing protein [Bizionia gelidisalsuginis]